MLSGVRDDGGLNAPLAARRRKRRTEEQVEEGFFTGGMPGLIRPVRLLAATGRLKML